MNRTRFLLVSLFVLTNVLASISHQNSNTLNNNFQSLYELVNPSAFLQNYANQYSIKPDIDLTMNGLGNININNTDNYFTPLWESTQKPPELLSNPNPDPPGMQIETVRGPQSLTIFMNFQNDGTTSLQVLNQNSLNWFDLGNCRHGQIFHTLTGLCVDLFCIEGYTLTAQGKLQNIF